MGKTLDDDNLNNMSAEELAAKLKESIAEAEKWEAENPDPER